jgi:hypothetical protein
MPQPLHNDDRVSNSPAERLLASANGYAALLKKIERRRKKWKRAEDAWEAAGDEEMESYCHGGIVAMWHCMEDIKAARRHNSELSEPAAITKAKP